MPAAGVGDMGVAHHFGDLGSEDEVVVYLRVQCIHRIGLTDVVGQVQTELRFDPAIALDVVLIDW